MEPSTIATLNHLAHQSHAGELHFGYLIGRLMEVGVESYRVDYRLGSTDYFLPSGAAHTVQFPPSSVPIAESLDAGALKECIRGAQRGELRYPQFVEQSRAAGVVGYVVWIAGRHVVYFGRRGEQHVEHFPSTST